MTTSSGVVRSARDRPEPSTTAGSRWTVARNCETTAAPAVVLPPAPKRAPSAFSSISAKKSSEGTAVSLTSVAIGGECSVTSRRASNRSATPACERPVTTTPSWRSVAASREAA